MNKKIIIYLISFVVVLIILFMILNSKSLVEKRTIDNNLKDLNYIKNDLNKDLDFLKDNLRIEGESTTEYERFVIHGAADKFINNYEYNINIDSKKNKLYLNFTDKKSKQELNDNFDITSLKELLEILSINYQKENLKIKTQFNSKLLKKASITYEINNMTIKYDSDIYTIENGKYVLKILNVDKNEYQINITYKDKEYIFTKTETEEGKRKYFIVHDKINITITIEDEVTINILSNLTVKLNYNIKKIDEVKRVEKTKNLSELYKNVPAYRFYLLNLKGKM